MGGRAVLEIEIVHAESTGPAGCPWRLALLVPLLLGLAAASVGCPGGPLDPSRRGPERVPTHPPDGSAPDPERAFLADVRQLTFAGRRSGEGYFDRVGRRMVFQSEREPGNPFYQIYLMDPVAGRVQRLSPGVGKTTCGWIHPGGRRVLFASTHADPRSEALQKAEIEKRAEGGARHYQWDYDPSFDLYSVDLDEQGELASEPRALAPARGYDAEGSYSPDGRWIVFASNRHAYDPVYASAFSASDRARLERDPASFVDLYLMDAHGGDLRRLTDSPGYDGGPFFSPDGRRIVWRRFGEDGKTAEIFSIGVDGSDERQLTHLGVLSWAPFYHPSGDYVVFSTNLHGFDDFELYAVDARGERDPIRITRRPKFDGLPAFLPDGRSLSWTSQRTPDGSSQIFRARWNDAEVRRRLDLPAQHDATATPLLPVPDGMHEAIDADDLRLHVEALTSDAADGRLTGTPGEKIATGYVARVFRAIGLEPAGDHGTYFHEFTFTAGVSLGEDNALETTGTAPGAPAPVVDVDWRPLAFSGVGEFGAAPVVFAGYGLVSPAGGGVPARDDFAGLDLEDRWVLVLRDVPGGASAPARRHWRRFASLRHKAMLARDRGARGVVFVRGPHSKLRHQLPDLALDGSLAGTRIAVAAATDALVQSWLAATSPGRDLGRLQAALDGGEAVEGFELGELSLSARIDLVQQRRRGRNVIGRLRRPAAAAAEEEPPPALVLGAHVDHLGRGPSTASLSTSNDPDQLHRGADDNASGVATLIEIAQWMAAQQSRGELAPARDVLFAAWSGEELGLLGSSRWVDAESNPHEPFSERVAAYLNMDMVGRLRDSLMLYGAASSGRWPALVERENLSVELPVQLLDDSYLPTDATTFYLAGSPILSAFTGVHEQYHKPEDTADLLDYEGMSDIGRLVAGIARAVAEDPTAPDYVATPPPRGGPPRAGLRVYLGTVPDYARSDVRGVRLSGVTSDGPAEKGGLRAGDVIVRVGERQVENIYDYTYALGDLEIDEPVEIVVERDGRSLRLTVVPGSRN
ncbi:MAG: M28 family peptidase [Myxococcota bacterium]